MAFDAIATNAATAPLKAALAAGNTPLTFSAKELDASWRRFKPSKALNSNFNVMPYEQTVSGDSELYSYFTRGETLKVGDETFLLAYRASFFFYQPMDQSVSEDASDAASNGRIQGKDLPANFNENIATSDMYPRVMPSQTLSLCLLNVRTIDGLGDIRAFDAKTDLINIVTAADKAQSNTKLLTERASLTGDAVNQRVDSDLKQIGLALLMYTQDYDEKLPPMRSSQSMADIKKTYWETSKQGTVQQVLTPYMKSQELFAHPTTREIYRPNLSLSGRSLAGLDGVDTANYVVTFYEASPAPDGTRAVLYLDGHVKREREIDWAAIRAASDAIAPPFNAGKRISIGSPASATVTLYDAAAMAYMLRRQRDNKGRPQEVYLSKSTNRVYYRDAQTHQAIWLSSPDGKVANDGITIPYTQAQEFREFQGYNGQPFGRSFVDNSATPMIVTPNIKTALGANAALRGSQIDVDTTLDDKTVVLRGTTTNKAQKELAGAIARKSAPGFRIINQLFVKR